jgi:hypothetical protein
MITLWKIIKFLIGVFLVASGLFIWAVALASKDATIYDYFDSGLVWFIIGLSLALTGIFINVKRR